MTTPSKQARKRRIPSLCRHKATGQAVVRLDGTDVYCGVHGTPEAQERYERAIAEWLLTGQPAVSPSSPPPPVDPRALTVNELVLAYWSRHVTNYYTKKGRLTSEVDN